MARCTVCISRKFISLPRWWRESFLEKACSQETVRWSAPGAVKKAPCPFVLEASVQTCQMARSLCIIDIPFHCGRNVCHQERSALMSAVMAICCPGFPGCPDCPSCTGFLGCPSCPSCAGSTGCPGALGSWHVALNSRCRKLRPTGITFAQKDR